MSGTESAGSAEPNGAAAPMPGAEVRWRLLVSAAEDYSPLFQALWEFGVPASPRAGAPSEDEIKTALWSLIDQGLVDLFHGVDANDDFIPVPPQNRRQLFADPQSWRVLEDPAVDVRYSTTATGDEAVAVEPTELSGISWESP
jgi:hypothetical protein